MKTPLRSGLVVLQLLLALVVAERAAFAADEDKFLGNWALNPSKSSGPAGVVPSSATMALSKTSSEMYKSVSELSLGGQSQHSEITFAIDGKEYSPVTTPAPQAGTMLTESFERVSAGAYKASVKLNGMLVATILYELSADGKTLTSTTTGVGAAANVSAKLVFERITK